MAKPLKSRHNTRSQCDEKPQRDEKTGRFLMGNSGNGGRKPGSRNKLAGEFLDALAEDFSKHGVEAIEEVRKNRPDKYLNIIAGLLPRNMELNVDVHASFFEGAKDWVEHFRFSRDYIGAEAPLLIEADDE